MTPPAHRGLDTPPPRLTPPNSRKPLLNPLRDSSHFTNQAVARLESPRTQKEAVPSSSRWDRFAVREGGVEPPRPCGHWNLNPARLPIPPPAHWVCPRALPFRCWRLPTSRRLARWGGWVHIPYPGRAPPRITGHGATSEGRTPARSATYRRVLVHVSTSYRSRPSPLEEGRVHSQVRDTGLVPPLRSLAEFGRG
jgi:hypothetical protein